MACFLCIASSDVSQGQEAGGANLACSLVFVVVVERLQSCEQDLLDLKRQQGGNFFLCHCLILESKQNAQVAYYRELDGISGSKKKAFAAALLYRLFFPLFLIPVFPE